MKYMIKKIIIGVCIALVLSCIRSCEVKAADYYPYLNAVTNYFNNTSLTTTSNKTTLYNLYWAYGTTSRNTTSISGTNFHFLGIPVGFTGIGSMNFQMMIDSRANISTVTIATAGSYYPCEVSSNLNIPNNEGSEGSIVGYSMVYVTCPNVNFHTSNANFYIRSIHIANFGFSMTIGSYLCTESIQFSKNTEVAIEQSVNNVNNNVNNVNNSVNNVNNSINDSSVDSSNTNSTLDGLNNNLPTSGTISSLILMPITLAQSYLNGMNSSCSTYSMGTVLGVEINLPCINLSNLLGSTLISIIDILFSGFMIFAIGKKMVRVFNDFTNLKDGQINDVFGGGSE